MTPIFHITSADEVAAARSAGEYRPRAFQREHFVHCSYEWQIATVANRLFRGRNDLVLLELDPTRLGCPVIEENLEGGSELFPHVYGPIPLPAIVRVIPFAPSADGSFPPLSSA